MSGAGPDDGGLAHRIASGQAGGQNKSALNLDPSKIFLATADMEEARKFAGMVHHDLKEIMGSGNNEGGEGGASSGGISGAGSQAHGSSHDGPIITPMGAGAWASYTPPRIKDDGGDFGRST